MNDCEHPGETTYCEHIELCIECREDRGCRFCRADVRMGVAA